MLDLFLELLPCLRLKAVQQVFLQVVEGLHLGGAVASTDACQHVDELAPLLGLGENENERVEKLGRKNDRALHGTLEETLRHLESTLLLLLVVEVHQVSSDGLRHILGQNGCGGRGWRIRNQLAVDLSELVNLALGSEDL